MIGNIYLGIKFEAASLDWPWLRFRLHDPRWRTRIVSHLSHQQKMKKLQLLSKAMQEVAMFKIEMARDGYLYNCQPLGNSDDDENDGELGTKSRSSLSILAFQI